MSTNPYATPRAAVADEPVTFGAYVPGGKKVPASRGWTWIVDGWSLFRESPGLWIGIIVVLFVMLMLMAFIPFVGSVAMSLLMPVFVGGLMLGCRALDEGRGLEFNHLFAGFQAGAGTLIAVGALSLAASIAIVLVIAAVAGVGVFAFMAGGADAQAMGAMGVLAVLLAVLVFFALSLPIAMALWFAPALVVLHGLGAVEAMKASFMGCLRNILPFIVYGLVGLVLAIVASIPIGLGWLVLGPVLAASVYTAYKDIYLA